MSMFRAWVTNFSLGIGLLAGAVPAASASDVREIVFQGQFSETFEMRDRLKTGGNWGHSEERPDVVAQVSLEFGAVPPAVSPKEIFVVKLDEDSLSVTVKSSGKVLISQRAPEILMDRTSRRVLIDAKYRFSFLNIDPILNVLEAGISKVQAKNGLLFFEAAPDFFENGFLLRLSISSKRFFGAGGIVFDQQISPSFLKRTPTNKGLVLYSGSFESLGVPQLDRGRFVMDAFVSFDAGSESILNSSDLPKGGRAHKRTDVRAADIDG